MPEPGRIVEVVARVAPLALRFHDDLLGLPVGDGLEVTAHPPGRPALRVGAQVCRSGVFVFHRLPGLVALPQPPARPRLPVLFGSGDGAYWSSLPGPRPFVVEVRDALGRFLPISFEVEAPTRGPFQPTCLPVPASSPASPPDSDASVPLFSSPTRGAAVPVAVVRAELWDPLLGAPAAWALVEGRAAGGRWFRGLADARGRLALFLGYPPPPDPFTSPPSTFVPGLGPALTAQEWDLELRARYASPTSIPEWPDLCDVLAQPPAALWTSYASRQPLACPPIRYGQELTLRSEDAGPGAGGIRIGP